MKFKTYMAYLGIAALTIGNAGSIITSAAEAETEISTDAGIESVSLITDVVGDGQKAAAVVIKYSSVLDASSLDLTDYQVLSENVSEIDEYSITAVYTSDEAAIGDNGISGSYVIIELDMENYILSGYGTAEDSGGMGGHDVSEDKEAEESESGQKNGFGGGRGTDNSSDDDIDNSDGTGRSGNFGGGMSMSFASDGESNNIQVTVIQSGDVSGEDGTVYAASETEYTTSSEENTNLLVDNFVQYTFTGSDGTELKYNLYLPDDYDETAAYPIVLFMPDATGTSDTDTYRTLTQGLGAVIWTDEESQSENPAIVLAPQYETANESTDLTMELLTYIVESYAVDESRIYLTGQSAGTIRSIEMMITYPDYFAGALLVAGQADDAYTDRLAELAGQNIWMIASTGDARALPGMTAIQEAVEAAGTEVTYGEWSALLSEEEQNASAEAMEENDTSIYFTVLSDVVPEGISDSDATEHMNTWRVAYSISEIRSWLFEQSL